MSLQAWDFGLAEFLCASGLGACKLVGLRLWEVTESVGFLELSLEALRAGMTFPLLRAVNCLRPGLLARLAQFFRWTDGL